MMELTCRFCVRGDSSRVLSLAEVVVAGMVFAWLAPALADEPRKANAPSAVASAPDGTLYVAELSRPGILKRDDQGKLAVAVAGSSKLRSPLHAVTALAVGSDGTLFAADRATGEVYRIEPAKPPEPMTAGAFEIPTGLVATPEGDLIVCDLRLGAVYRVGKGGGTPKKLADVSAPRGVALGNGGEIVVLSMGPNQLLRVASDGTVTPIVKGKPFQFPLALLRDRKEPRFLISDGYAGTVWAVSDSGEVQAWLKGAPLVRPEGLAQDSSGAILVADAGASQVFHVEGPKKIERLLKTP